MNKCNKIKGFILFVVLAVSVDAAAQTRYNGALLDTLEYIATQEGAAKHFAQLYHRVIEQTNDYAATKTEPVRSFVFGFETLFASLFFQSYHQQEQHRQQETPWVPYYDSTKKNALQYMFMGMNAHINGDMCLALVHQFNKDTIQHYRMPLLHFQKVLNHYFDSVYNTSKAYPKIKTLHLLTLGADKWLGHYIIWHWRKRQVRMALLYVAHPLRYQRMHRRLQKKMKRYDAFALRWFR